MTSDALLALRPCEVVPEETVRDWLHTVEHDLDRLDSAVRQAEADADEAERSVDPDLPPDEVAQHFARELRRSLEDLVSTTQQDLREALDEAHRHAETRLAQARSDAERLRHNGRSYADHPVAMRNLPPVLAVVQDDQVIELRTPELSDFASEAEVELAPEAPVAVVEVVIEEPVATVDELTLTPDRAAETESAAVFGAESADQSLEAAHEAFWSESDEVAAREHSYRDVFAAAVLPMLAAVLLLVALLLWLG